MPVFDAVKITPEARPKTAFTNCQGTGVGKRTQVARLVNLRFTQWAIEDPDAEINVKT